MEYWIDLKIKPKNKYFQPINRFVESAVNGEVDSIEEIFSEISDVALEKYIKIKTHEYYGSYINHLQGCLTDKKSNKISIDITTGGMGPEFSVALVDLLGEYCEEIIAYVTHDEDFGHIPIELTYAQGKVYEDGEEIALRTFEEEVIDSWVEEPIVDKDILKPIQDICKKATADTSFLELTKIYIELYTPITTVAKKYDLLTDLLDGDDKDEYLEYIEKVLNLSYYKEKHPVFTFFKNKMHENLQEMSKTEYLGSLFHEYKKTLVTFYVFCDAVNDETEGTFEELFEEINNQADFDLVYEMTALFELGEEE